MIAKKPGYWHRMMKTVKLGWLIAALAVIVVEFVIALWFYIKFDQLNPYWQGVATNLPAGLLDVLLVVVGFGVYEQFRERSDAIARLRESIENEKRIDDTRAHSILAASIRGLAKFGLTDIDLRGAHLTNFSFRAHGIRSIAGAVISDGLDMSDETKNFPRLCGADFTGVNCDRVCFGNGQLSLGVFEDCNFRGASLVNATFDDGTLRWSKEKVVVDESDWYEFMDNDEDGMPMSDQIYFPAFEEADLTNCSFRNVQFENADFRGARNIDKANFKGANGLATCHFDEGQKPPCCRP